MMHCVSKEALPQRATVSAVCAVRASHRSNLDSKEMLFTKVSSQRQKDVFLLHKIPLKAVVAEAG